MGYSRCTGPGSGPKALQGMGLEQEERMGSCTCNYTLRHATQYNPVFPGTHENSKRPIIFLYVCFLPFEHHFRVLTVKMIHFRPIMICEYFIRFQLYFSALKENTNLHVSDADVFYFPIEMLKVGCKICNIFFNLQ